jgi:Spy/CpxP family protein refolding chaperone
LRFRPYAIPSIIKRFSPKRIKLLDNHLTNILCRRQKGSEESKTRRSFEMDKRAFLVLTLVAFLTIGVSIAASAAQEKGATSSTSEREQLGEPFHGKPGFETFMKKLGITDEQKKQFRNLQVAFKDKTRKARSELMSLNDEKRTMLMSGKVDQQKLSQIDDQIVKLRADVMREALKLKRDRLALLTPEQQERIADFEAEKALHHRMMHRPRGPHHGGPPNGPMMHHMTPGGGPRGPEAHFGDEGGAGDEARLAGAGPHLDED